MKKTIFIPVLVLLLGVVGYCGYLAFFQNEVYVTCKVCKGTGKVDRVKNPCSSSTCPDGTIPCPNHCLKREDGGWQTMHVDGHSDTDLWMKFTYPNGSWAAWSQAHIGHVIEMVNGKYQDTGLCPVCHGTTRVVCPECKEQKECPFCNGQGKVLQDS